MLWRLTIIFPLLLVVFVFGSLLFLGGQGQAPTDYAGPTVLLWKNTFSLLVGVLFLSFLLGFGSAYLLGRYRWPFESLLTLLLILPLSLPGYILAFCYTSFFNQLGFSSIAWLKPFAFLPQEHPLLFSIVCLSFSLYPYVFLIVRRSFDHLNQEWLEAAQNLDAGFWKTFFKVEWPHLKNWLFAGLILVAMEALADFGTVSIFNLDTFTTEIYRVWLSFFSIEYASQLSLILLIPATFLLVLDYRTQKKVKDLQTDKKKPPQKSKVSGLALVLGLGFFLSILLLALGLPLGVLGTWLLLDWDSFALDQIGLIILNTFGLAFLGTVLIIGIGLLMNLGLKSIQKNFWLGLSRLALAGYALPGSILAIAAFGVIAFVQNFFESFFQVKTIDPGSFLFFGLMAAYLLRFLMPAFQTLQTAFNSVSPQLDLASQNLGFGRVKTFLKVHLPLIKRSFFTAFLLVFVDLIKEMPLTLMLRPTGWDTLAVKIYNYTSEGAWQEAAPYAFVIAFMGLIVSWLIKPHRLSS